MQNDFMNTFYEIKALHPDPGVGQDVLVAGVVLERLVRDAAVRGDRGLSTQKWTDSYHTSHSGNL